MTTVHELVTDSVKLFTLPEVYLRLKQVLDDPESSLSKVAEVIVHDPALTARLLRMVNSAYFGFGQKIETVSHAINMLGSQQVHDLALATAITRTFSDMPSEVLNMDKFWQDSVYCAVLARLLANRCNVIDSERLFVAGLLCDIGHLVMYQKMPQQMQQAIQRSRQEGIPLSHVEKDLIGFDFAEAGSELMRIWGLPTSLQMTTQYHLTPGHAPEYELQTAIVHIASMITGATDAHGLSADTEQLIDPVAWQITGLSPESLELLIQEAGQQLAQAENLLFPAVQKSSTVN